MIFSVFLCAVVFQEFIIRKIHTAYRRIAYPAVVDSAVFSYAFIFHTAFFHYSAGRRVFNVVFCLHADNADLFKHKSQHSGQCLGGIAAIPEFTAYIISDARDAALSVKMGYKNTADCFVNFLQLNAPYITVGRFGIGYPAFYTVLGNICIFVKAFIEITESVRVACDISVKRFYIGYYKAS